ncbi:hypothetical protein BZA77DRAFT_361272 [Pyronema omphalodes]|nr:hypothetical protein BZA77DRAFT_361272 [Pyronema omphalodes]
MSRVPPDAIPPRRKPTVAFAQQQRSLRSFATKVSKGSVPRAAAEAKETIAAGTKRKLEAAKISAAIAIIQDKVEVTARRNEEDVSAEVVELGETETEKDITSEEAPEEKSPRKLTTEQLTGPSTEEGLYKEA